MDNTVDNVEDKVGGQKPKKSTPKSRKSASLKTAEKDAVNSPQNVEEKDADYIDSDGSNIEQSLTSILGVPTETVNTEEQTAESKADVLSGMGGSTSQQFNEEPDIPKFAEDVGDDSPFFEDNELLADVGVELIDMMMTYGAMAIAQDFGNEEKYAVSPKRRNRLKEPLAKILQNREIKTAPELAFAFMIVAAYSPIMIAAVQERNRKKKAKKGNPIQSSEAVVTPAPKMSVLNDDDLSIEPSPKKDVEVPDGDDAMAEMMAKMKPKRKSGRPVGGTDLKPRKALSDEDRNKEIQKAKALRKDGWSFSRIAKELNVSEGTATQWVRS